MTAYRIGSIVIPEPTSYRQTYETASWFTEYAIPAGEYPVMASVEWSGERGGWYIPYWCAWYVAPGTITASLFVNRLLWERSSVVNEHAGRTEPVNVPVGLRARGLTLLPGLLMGRGLGHYESPSVRMEAIKAAA